MTVGLSGRLLLATEPFASAKLFSTKLGVGPCNSLLHLGLRSRPRAPLTIVNHRIGNYALPQRSKAATTETALSVLESANQHCNPTQSLTAGNSSWQSSSIAVAATVGFLLLNLYPPASHALPVIDAVGQTFSVGASGSNSFNEGFLSSFLLILFSEIGDKTFFIAVLLALQQSRSTVFVGTFGALAVMTVISVALGRVFHELDEILPSVGLPLDDVLAAALLVYFGLTTLQQAFADDNEGEREEAEEVVATMGTGTSSALVLSTFALVFAAEWGDKSFLATIALAAASSPAGVVSGAVAGHAAATALAVLGGSVLGRYASAKVLNIVGGTLFLVFAAGTFYEISTKL